MVRPPYLQPMSAAVARFRLAELLASHDPPLSQAELSRRSGVSHVTVNALANNKTTRVDLLTLERLARALGVQPGDLIEGDPPPPKGRQRSK
jgi:DNA-binding Xre family transcriptional regulator